MRTNDKTNWEARLRGEKNVPTHPDDPDYGYYRVRSRDKQDWHAIAYWYGKDGALRCRKDGQDIDEKAACEQWTFASENPITYELYSAVLGGAPWPDLNEVVTRSNQAPPDNSFVSLSEHIDDLAREAKRLIEKGAAKTQDEADQASDVANRLGKFWTDADNARQAEKAPHLTAERYVDDKWRPPLTAASIYKRLKDIVVTPFLVKKRQEQERAAAEARRQAEQAALAGDVVTAEQTAKKAQAIESERITAGTRGRSTGLKSPASAEVTDWSALFLALVEHPKMRAEAQSIANASARAGVPLAGTKIVKTPKAA